MMGLLARQATRDQRGGSVRGVSRCASWVYQSRLANSSRMSLTVTEMMTIARRRCASTTSAARSPSAQSRCELPRHNADSAGRDHCFLPTESGARAGDIRRGRLLDGRDQDALLRYLRRPRCGTLPDDGLVRCVCPLTDSPHRQQRLWLRWTERCGHLRAASRSKLRGRLRRPWRYFAVSVWLIADKC